MGSLGAATCSRLSETPGVWEGVRAGRCQFLLWILDLCSLVCVCVCVFGCGWSWALFDVVGFLPGGQNQLGPLTDPQLRPTLETALGYLPPGQVS